MSLRLRLIVAFFLVSVLPLAVVTLYTYTSNARALREAASREAEVLAGELAERMKLVTAQLSQQFEQLIEMPAAAQLQPTVVSAAGTQAAAKPEPPTPPASPEAKEIEAAKAQIDEATRVAGQLGEVAMLLNNIEIHGYGRGRGRGPGERPPGDRSRGPDSEGRRSGPSPQEPFAPSRLQIDLGPLRRDMLRQLFPDRERWEQLSQEEREMILSKVNERMLGVQQGIQILQQKASEQAADAKAAAATATEIRKREARLETPRPPPPPKPAVPAPPTPPNVPSRQRKTALSGSQMDVRVMQNGEVVGQVNAEINLPNLLLTVFTTTRRDKGEVPFAVDKKGGLYTPTEADRAIITGLNSSASQPGAPPGTVLLPNWVVVTTADPTGSELKFGIARPLDDALDDLRRSSTRDALLGLGLVGIALIGIFPLSSRLTRNLSRLSDGVNQIAKGDYRARVDVSSKDEIGRLASAFNLMAADVERHERDAVEQERLRRELELGRQIQHEMLPHGPLRLGLTEIRGVSVPATEVGGDFFNYFQTSSGKIALVVGDVSGKGVGAALLMANIQASLRTRLALGQDLVSLARELDLDIGASTPGAIYATLFVGLLDPATRDLEYVNAGHNPQYILRSSGGLERMESTGLPIGLLAGHPYTEGRASLAAGDVVFFYTDGCVEAENRTGDMFGNDRLEALLTVRPAGPGDRLLTDIEREITNFRSGTEAFDDATMMVVTVG